MKRAAQFFLIGLVLAGTIAVAAGGPQGARADGPWPNISVQLVAGGFTQPLRVVTPPDGTGRLFVVEQAGRIRIIMPNGTVLPTPFLNIPGKVLDAGNEQGLLGLAFAPDYATSRRFYINYIRGSGSGETVVARLRTKSADPNSANKKSLTPLWTLDQPATNHNGGHMVFGPDGQLWISMGDGGGSPQNRPQDNASLFGKLLRAPVTTNSGPFVPTWWAKGLRNPWTFSFDPLTNDLYVADVGSQDWEEVNMVPAGTAAQTTNFGWAITEGMHCFPPGTSCTPPSPYTPPVAEYSHDDGCSITGGSVYRGSESAAMYGVYFFADFCRGTIYAMRPDGDDPGTAWDVSLRLDTNLSITAFGVDGDGEILVVDRGGGIYRINSSN
jgi:glucose/arabinose dehydrogenase